MARRKLHIQETRDGGTPDDAVTFDLRGIDWISVTTRKQESAATYGTWLVEVSNDGKTWSTAESFYDYATGGTSVVGGLTADGNIRHINVTDVPMGRVRNTYASSKTATPYYIDITVYGEGEDLIAGDPATIVTPNRPVRLSTATGVPNQTE